MLVSFGLGNPVGISGTATTHVVQSVGAVLKTTPIKAILVPKQLVALFRPARIIARLDTETIAKIMNKPIHGVVD